MSKVITHPTKLSKDMPRVVEHENIKALAEYISNFPKSEEVINLEVDKDPTTGKLYSRIRLEA